MLCKIVRPTLCHKFFGEKNEICDKCKVYVGIKINTQCSGVSRGCSECSSTPPRRKVVGLLANYNTQPLAREEATHTTMEIYMQLITGVSIWRYDASSGANGKDKVPRTII